MTRLLVLGNAALDLALRLPRLPLPGETLLADGQAGDVGGKGLNQAVAAGRCGVPVRLATALGTDAKGQRIRAALAAEGLAVEVLRSVEAPTDRSIVLVGADGQNMIVTTADQARGVDAAAAEAACAGLAPGDFLLVQGNLPADATGAALAAARQRGARTLANPSPLWFDWPPLLADVDLVLVNEPEAAMLDLGPADAVVVTRGADGAVLRDRQGRQDEVAAPAVQAVDTTGAGDVLAGVLAAGLCLGMAPLLALRWGVAAASLKVGRQGTLRAFPDAAELQRLRP
ncbi:PfkB family carbohydrate kinase [Geminicoccus harenae]|uniref:PfkB family carbohydrate kinase n=2 Tax=Geminicoccus harenae TaxID=2498453 RepID=UPI001C94FF50|nr:PfkB family carbohydrate kinase [Geminicoccus harenae]